MININEKYETVNLRGFFNAFYNLLEEYEKEGTKLSLDDMIIALKELYGYVQEFCSEDFTEDMLRLSERRLDTIKNGEYSIERAVYDLRQFCRKIGVKL